MAQTLHSANIIITAQSNSSSSGNGAASSAANSATSGKSATTSGSSAMSSTNISSSPVSGSPTAQGRASFGSKFGLIMAAAGSAVGLGNIWRFPVETGDNGGAAFILVYIVSVLLLGVPLMVAEFMVGRHSHSNTAHAYRSFTKSRFWGNIGFIGVAAAALIMCYYIVVSGWMLKYLVMALQTAAEATVGGAGPLSVDGISHGQMAQHFTKTFSDFSSSVWEPLIYMVVFTGLVHVAIVSGVKRGIEALSKVLMPALFVILLILVVCSMMTPGAKAGLGFLFHPDFSKITGKVVLDAVAQSFYSLSLCMGCLCTYASYFNKDVKLVNSAISIVSIDTIVAIMAGMIIFPAVFSAGIDPQAGPSLVFIALPCSFQQAFASLPVLGLTMSVLFYLLLVLAVLTSAISIEEVTTAYVNEAWHVKRSRAALYVTLFSIVLGAVCSLSMGVLGGFTLNGKNVFDLFDYVTTTLMLPVCGILTSIFIGWKIPASVFYQEITNNHTVRARGAKLILFLLKWVAPVLLILAFLNGLDLI